MNISDKLITIADNMQRVYEAGKSAGGGYDQGYEDGKNSVIPLERYLVGGRFKSLNIFRDEEAVINLDSATSLDNLFSVSTAEDVNTTVKHLTINCPNQITTMRYMVYCANNYPDMTLKRVTLNVDTQKVSGSSMYHFFSNLRALEIIDGQPIDATSATSYITFPV